MSKFHFTSLSRQLKAKYPEILEKMANEAVNHAKVTNFDREAFVDDQTDKWPARKSRRDNAGRRLLVKTGKLRQSIRILSRASNKIQIGTLVHYGKYHNFGTKRLPKRQFLGDSRVVDRKNNKILQGYIHYIISRRGVVR